MPAVEAYEEKYGFDERATFYAEDFVVPHMREVVAGVLDDYEVFAGLRLTELFICGHQHIVDMLPRMCHGIYLHFADKSSVGKTTNTYANPDLSQWFVQYLHTPLLNVIGEWYGEDTYGQRLCQEEGTQTYVYLDACISWDAVFSAAYDFALAKLIKRSQESN